MKKASTRLLEQETQTPSPAPDLIPAESSTENLHWDWYSKRGHFNPRNSQDQISKNGRLAYVSQRPSGSAALLLVVTEAKSPSLRKPRRLDWIRAKARFELSMLLVRTKTAGQKGAFAHDDYRM